MKKCIVLLVAMAVCSTVVADPLKIHITTSPGLPYIVTHVSGGPSWFPTTFETFCTEKTVYYTPNSEYYATIDSLVLEGGNIPGTSTPVGTTLSDDVKKIYAAYLNNAFTGSGATYNDVDKIQHAIWADRGYFVKTTADQALIDYVNLAGVNVAGYQNVRALNLWSSYDSPTGIYSGDQQSQLVMVPIPGAYLLGALGLGVANWRLKRRRNV